MIENPVRRKNLIRKLEKMMDSVDKLKAKVDLANKNTTESLKLLHKGLTDEEIESQYLDAEIVDLAKSKTISSHTVESYQNNRFGNRLKKFYKYLVNETD